MSQTSHQITFYETDVKILRNGNDFNDFVVNTYKTNAKCNKLATKQTDV